MIKPKPTVSIEVDMKTCDFKVDLGRGKRTSGDAFHCLMWLSWYINDHVNETVAERVRKQGIWQRRRELTMTFGDIARDMFYEFDTTPPHLPRRIPLDPGWFVYVARARTGIVQYVGMTGDVYGRLSQHRRTSPWWHACNSVTLFKANDRTHALKLESRMIRGLRPEHNAA